MRTRRRAAARRPADDADVAAGGPGCGADRRAGHRALAGLPVCDGPAHARAGIRAATRLTVECAAGRQAILVDARLAGWSCARPGGDERVHLVLMLRAVRSGGDDLALSVDVGPR